MTAPVFLIIGGTQSYDWGKLGRDSKAAQYALGGIPGFQVDENKPYAELWMGTHASLPSYLLNSGEKLSDHLTKYPSLIGNQSIKSRFPETKSGNLPFLFKVLAIRKALSIQAHPDKKLAEKLHVERPDLYKDDNHKPEMAIALTPFTGLCGFRPLTQISIYLSHVSEFAALVPRDIITLFQSNCTLIPSDPLLKAALRDVFSALMTAPPVDVKAQLEMLVGRYKSGGIGPEEAEGGLPELVIRLDEQFPGDVGCFCVFLLNIVRLNPGEAIFLGAGEPHAYIDGDIVETMATSDNVLRAGLTPKTRDVPNLVSSLTYAAADSSMHLVKPQHGLFSGSHTKLYDPPIPEFSVAMTKLSKGEKEDHPGVNGPSLAIVTAGNGSVHWHGGEMDLKEGGMLFVSADVGVTFVGDMEIFRAFVEA
ncbi:mannos-6-phosphate isomerase [Hysterangium stoloniferum]|nr:mannos-6-phosphate isomerase [Hysterangium stoloniferum]